MQLDPEEVAVFQQGVLLITTVYDYEMNTPTFDLVCPDLVDLPPGAICLSPFLQLAPENVDFAEPVRVYLPVCSGADTAWQSTPDGWEELSFDAVSFDAGHACRSAHVRILALCGVALSNSCVPKAAVAACRPVLPNVILTIDPETPKVYAWHTSVVFSLAERLRRTWS